MRLLLSYKQIEINFIDSEKDKYIIRDDAVKPNNHTEICSKIDEYDHILFVFPLYADGIPVTLLNFLKSLEDNPPENKSTINLIINCGFMEPTQNKVCIDMMRLFCKQNGYNLGSVLSIESGEAILGIPFKFLVKYKIKKLSEVIYNNRSENLSVTMPISKKCLLKLLQATG